MKSINPKFTASPSSISHSTERENKKGNKKRKSKTPRQRGGDRGRRPQQQQPPKRPPQGSVGPLRPIRPRLPPIGTKTHLSQLFDFFQILLCFVQKCVRFFPLQSAALAPLLLADLRPAPPSSAAAAARGEGEGEDLGLPLETLHSGASREEGYTTVHVFQNKYIQCLYCHFRKKM